ncbi:hypothetical protein HPB47_006962 [Ixodes persulcatus]|uniref:Uncharacterized protein n=1 Tax=Ixodes persulcatus TaxID=34615 RepID=A0AC60P8X2_IXOPE|nr:hypothetical protein HPB47_006962 [Ixodes persulcatus]
MFRFHMFYSRTPQHHLNPIDLQRPSPKMELARNLTRATRYLPSNGRASQRQFPRRCQDPSANGVPRIATVEVVLSDRQIPPWPPPPAGRWKEWAPHCSEREWRLAPLEASGQDDEASSWTPVYEERGPKWCVASSGGPRRVQTYPGFSSTTRMPFSPDTGSPRTARRGPGANLPEVDKTACGALRATDVLGLMQAFVPRPTASSLRGHRLPPAYGA